MEYESFGNVAMGIIDCSGICGFVSYFEYKDYFSGKEMIAMLCAM